jgi:hypothetical protein
MKKLALFIVLIISSWVGYSQNVVHIIRLNPDSALRDIRFSCLEVLDARTNKENIGFPIGNANAVAQFEGSFVGHLKSTFDKILPQEEGKLGLIVIIRDLEISEKTEGTSNQGFCRVEIEFAKKVDTLLHSLGIFDAHIVSKGSDITSSHDKRILLGLEECFRKLDETNWENAKKFIIEDIDHQWVYDYKNIPPKGVYLSYQQMVRRTPLDSVELKIKQLNDSKKNPVYNVKINKTDNPKQIQFVSDGESIYIRSNRYQFIKSTLLGKYIYFRGKFQTRSNSEIDLATGAAYVMAGVITGILTGIVIVPIGDSTGSNTPINGLVIETETGQLKGLTDFYIVNITKPFPEILKEYRASKRNLEAKENVIKQLNSKF